MMTYSSRLRFTILAGLSVCPLCQVAGASWLAGLQACRLAALPCLLACLPSWWSARPPSWLSACLSALPAMAAACPPPVPGARGGGPATWPLLPVDQPRRMAKRVAHSERCAAGSEPPAQHDVSLRSCQLLPAEARGQGAERTRVNRVAGLGG